MRRAAKHYDPTAEPLIAARAVERSFGPKRALAGLSLEVRAGEIFGLVGPDGAGKTTAIRALAGLIGVHGGEVRILGGDPLLASHVRDELGVMPQQYSLYGDLSVEENLRFFARMYGLSSREYRARAPRLLALTRLAPFTARRARALSGGMYKKLALACALLHEPSALLLDEPTNGVDPVSRRELWELLHEFVAQGMAVVISTAYMDEAARCHRVCLMAHGRAIATGSPDQLVRELEHPVFEVRDGDRFALRPRVEAHPGVLAASPTGERLRIVVHRDETGSVEALVARYGARLQRVAADFEDLFLVRTTHEAAS